MRKTFSKSQHREVSSEGAGLNTTATKACQRETQICDWFASWVIVQRQRSTYVRRKRPRFAPAVFASLDQHLCWSILVVWRRC